MTEVVKSRRSFWVISLLLVASAIGSWLASGYLQTSQASQAETAQPEYTVLTASVERRTLLDQLTIRGKLTSENLVEIPAPTVVAANADPLITASPVKVGDSVKTGTVVAEVAGRPIIVMSGNTPMYRDLTKEVVGKDVLQLQKNLKSLGISINDPVGTFGDETQNGVRKLYSRLGYSVEEFAQQASVDLAEDMQDSSLPSKEKGVKVSRSEIYFVSSLPSSVASINASVGSRAENKLLTLTSGNIVVEALLTKGESALVRAGQSAQVMTRNGSFKTSAKVVSVEQLTKEPNPANQPSAEDRASSNEVKAILAITSIDDVKAFAGDLKVSIDLVKSSNEVLAIPVSAMYSRADGQLYVTRKTGNQLKDIRIEAGVSAGGYVEIEANDGDLLINDQVVIGQQRNSSPNAKK